jgi:hypothetical protein
MTQMIEEPARRVPVKYDVDVLVVGGGSAGLAAAVGAARTGADVLLTERHGFLGGTLSMVTLGSICGLYSVSDDDVRTVVGGFAGELTDRLRARGAATGPMRWLETASMPYDPYALRLVADEMVLDAGVRCALHSTAVNAIMDGDVIRGVVFEGKAGRWACTARSVIDCTGDAHIAKFAGVPFDYDPGELQAPTAMFRFAGVDTERATRLSRDDLRACLEEAVAAGFELPRTAGGMFTVHPGFMHLNITRVMKDGRAPDPFNEEELTSAEFEGRRQLGEYQEAFRRFVPGFEKCFIADIGAELGIRESRRIHGAYELRLEDVMGQARFDDAVACSAWPVEEHTAGRGTRWVFLDPGTYYQLPFRMMVPKKIENLLVAGRCSSASHDAHASMRVSAICMALGDAAGIAAAAAVNTGVPVRLTDIDHLQEQLRRRGAFLGDDVKVPEL